MSERPSAVWAGRIDAPAVVVLDPVGAEAIPPAWQPLLEHVQVMWCSLPVADGPWREVDDLLSEFDERAVPVHLVTRAPASASALHLAGEHRGVVRSVLLIDPEVEPGDRARVVARSDDGALPLGDPAAVEAVVEALVGEDIGDDPSPPVPSLISDAFAALRESVAGVLDRVRKA
jgi:hypothetical protein